MKAYINREKFDLLNKGINVTTTITTHIAFDDDVEICESKKTLSDNEIKLGSTEKETLLLNGWGVGDILEGDEGYGTIRIKITAIGEERFLCKCDYKCNGIYSEEYGSKTLGRTEWKKIN
jgi:hypothetical protein